jgi:hypothetical protein
MNRNAAVSIACAGIWLNVAAASLLSPDLVSGSEQEHIPLAAITAWLWGLVSTGYVALLAAVRSDVGEGLSWRSLALAVVSIWSIAAAVSGLGPELVTGADPTRVPLSALIAPPAASLATGFVCLMHAILTLHPDQTGVPSRTTADYREGVPNAATRGEQ